MDFDHTPLWIGFSIFVVIALSIDTVMLNKRYTHAHESMKAALAWTSVWVTCALIFNVIFWWYVSQKAGFATAREKGLNFFTGYVIELSLSVDNLFAFYLVFHQLRIPVAFQQRVLIYGIWSAMILRFLVIAFFSYLLSLSHVFFYLMGGFLVLTGIKMTFPSEHDEKNIVDSKVLRFIKRVCKVHPELEGEAFIIKRKGWWHVTPLFLALVMVEICDVIFAMDSIPAIFAITTDPFIVWSSNIFAILGLRSLYFVLMGMVNRFSLLKYGLAIIIIFVGIKMLIAQWIEISVTYSLLFIASILTLFTFLSFQRASKS